LKLIVGLGNPGVDYADTRHNIGFMALDRLLAERSKTVEEARHYADSLIWRIRFAGRQIMLQKPLTYMNLSGKAVSKLFREQSLLPGEVLVISDDVDLPLGRIRIRQKGGDGGHNGLADIIGQLGTQSFNRLRIGIGRCSEANSDMAKFVLGAFSEVEEQQLPSVISTVAEAVKTAVRRGVATAMNQYNGLDVFENEETNETKEA
jgi:PTH1 family peptidyl-tRNA hydrolase